MKKTGKVKITIANSDKTDDVMPQKDDMIGYQGMPKIPKKKEKESVLTIK